LTTSSRLPSPPSSPLVQRGVTPDQFASHVAHEVVRAEVPAGQSTSSLLVALPERTRHRRPPDATILPIEDDPQDPTPQEPVSHNFGKGYIGEQNAMVYAKEHMTGAQLYEFMMQLDDPKARGAFYATVAGSGSGQNDLQAYVLEHMFGGDANARNNWINTNAAGGGAFSALGGVATYFDPVRGPIQQKLVGWPS
jgi:hypothetical protein